jgi:hypothetical protein
MKKLEKIWMAALLVFAICSVTAFVMDVNGSFDEAVNAQSILIWAAVVGWIVGAVVFAFDFWRKKRVSCFVAIAVVLGFGLALGALGTLCVASDVVPIFFMYDALSWASVGLFSVALFIMGVAMELRVLIHFLQKDWLLPKLLSMLTIGLVLMALGVIFITWFGLLGIGQAAVIAFSMLALISGCVSCLIVLAKKLLNIMFGILDEIIKGVGLG